MRRLFRRLCRWTEASAPLTRRQFLAAFALLFALLTLALIADGILIGANRSRLDEIQASRVASCEKTYGSFPEVFRPFFPADRRQWAPKQRHDWRKLELRIQALTRRCPSQTQAKGAR